DVEDRLAELRHLGELAQLVAALVEASERRNLKARICADEQLHWSDGGLDGAKTKPFRLTLRAAELARGIDADGDAVVGGLLQLRLEYLDVFMLHVVERLGRELHSVLLRPRRLTKDR